MFPYLALLGSFSIAATIGGRKRPSFLPFSIAFIVLSVFVGLRHQVGADWPSYLLMMNKATSAESLEDLFAVCEPLYGLVLIWGNWTGYGIYAADIITSICVVIGLFTLVKITPYPWLAIMAALPNYILVAAMSANRQIIAAGILMWLFTKWYKLSLVHKVAVIFLAAGFHISALVYLGLVGYELRARTWIKVSTLAIFLLVAYFVLENTGRLEYYDKSYGSGQSEVTFSSGAFMLIAVNAIPATFYFILPKYRQILFPTPLLKSMALVAMALLPMAYFASTASGRISLYWYPVSIWVWSSFPLIFAEKNRFVIKFFVSSLLIGILLIWLNFANNAEAHLPYQNALFVHPWELEIW